VLKLSAFDVFVGSIRSPATRTEYLRKLKKYEEFFKITNWDEYITNELGFDVLVKCPNEKKKEVHRY
jgi:hypothetical protein